MRHTIALSFFLTVLRDPLTATEVRPFSAVVLRTSRTEYRDGRPPLVEQIREVYYRSADGSSRRENWKATNGAPAQPPAFVTLFDAGSGRTYHLFDQARRAEWIRDGNSRSELEFAVTSASGQTVETHHALPCAVLNSIFLNAQREKIASGKACRSLDLGIVIYERMLVPHPKGDATVHWEADLERLDWSEPSPALMRVPPEFAILEVTQPAISCHGCSRK